MTQYKHGGDIYTALLESGKRREELLDFSANINPLGTPKGVQEAIQKVVGNLGDYPDPSCRTLRNKIAEKEKIEPHEIVCGNGAADLIFRMIYAFKPQKALLFAPTFSEYEKALTQNGCHCITYPLQEETNYQLVWEAFKRFLEAQKGIDLIFICNPNNPTGQVISQSTLLELLEICDQKNIIVVVDECFNDFLEGPEAVTMKSFLQDYKNLFILKAFTKLYALAGARLGYLLSANDEALQKVANTGQAWSVSTLAQVAGVAALDETEYTNKTKQLITNQRHYLKESLEKLGCKVYGSFANYVFFFIEEKGGSLEEGLREKHILIRDCSNYRGLKKGYYRIAVRTRQENEKLIKEIKEWKQWQKV